MTYLSLYAFPPSLEFFLCHSTYSSSPGRIPEKWINSFIDKTPEIIDQINIACGEGDWKSVGSLAHKLKPNLAFMGIDSLKDLVLEIETNGKENSLVENLPTLVNELTISVHEAIEELKGSVELSS